MKGWQKLNSWPPIGDKVLMSFGDDIRVGHFMICTAEGGKYPWVKPIIESNDITAEWPDYWLAIPKFPG